MKKQPLPQAEGVPIPASLDTPGFRSLWSDWLTHLRQSGKRPTTIYAREALAMLDAMGADAAAESLTTAIRLCRTYFDINDQRRPKNDSQALASATQDLFKRKTERHHG